MLQVKFIKKAAGLMRAAIDEARVTGAIFNTQWRELNGELYFRIPDEEVQPWLDLLESLAHDANEGYGEIRGQIEAMHSEDPWQSISREAPSEPPRDPEDNPSDDSQDAEDFARRIWSNTKKK